MMMSGPSLFYFPKWIHKMLKNKKNFLEVLKIDRIYETRFHFKQKIVLKINYLGGVKKIA